MILQEAASDSQGITLGFTGSARPVPIPSGFTISSSEKHFNLQNTSIPVFRDVFLRLIPIESGRLPRTCKNYLIQGWTRDHRSHLGEAQGDTLVKLFSGNTTKFELN